MLWKRVVVPMCIVVGAFLPRHINAGHLIGSYLQYECLGPTDGNTRDYLIRLHLLRDCAGAGAPFDDTIALGIYNRFNGTYFFARLGTVTHQEVLTLEPANSCGPIPPSICIETTVYEYLIESLPVIDDNWMIAWQRCCRPGDLANIQDPGRTGSAVLAIITPEAQLSCNNSPDFDLSTLPYVLCAGNPLQFQLTATDVDNDSLVIQFDTAYMAGGIAGSAEMPDGDPFSCEGLLPAPADCPPPYQSVVYNDPFSAYAPVGGLPSVAMDSITSTITGIADLQGRFLVGMTIFEYRNDTLIGGHPLEVTSLVTLCEPGALEVAFEVTPPSDIDSSDGSIQLIINGVPPYTVEWEGADTDNTILSGIGVGTFPVTVIDALGCSWEDVISVSLTRVQQVAALRPPVVVVPNPSSAGFMVRSPQTVLEVRCYDLAGMEVFRRPGPNVPAEALRPGVYLLLIRTASGVHAAKAIII